MTELVLPRWEVTETCQRSQSARGQPHRAVNPRCSFVPALIDAKHMNTEKMHSFAFMHTFFFFFFHFIVHALIQLFMLFVSPHLKCHASVVVYVGQGHSAVRRTDSSTCRLCAWVGNSVIKSNITSTVIAFSSCIDKYKMWFVFIFSLVTSVTHIRLVQDTGPHRRISWWINEI